METETNLVFANTDTGTLDPANRSAFVLDLNTLSDGVRDRLFGDDFFDEVIIGEVAESHGVSVADLWAAYEWRRAFDRGVADAHLSTGVTYGSPDSALSVAYDMGRNYGERAGDDQDYDNAHRCNGCGVTGGGVVGGLCQDCDGERADGWRFDESDDAWHHCDRRAYWDDNGVTCSKCQETMADDVAVEP